MLRKTPLEVLNVIGKFNKCPEEAVSDLWASKLQDEYFIKTPNWDTAGDSPQIYFISNERENADMRRLQKELEKNQAIQRVRNINHIRKTYSIVSSLRKRFITVNNFLRECNEKKRHAEHKLATEAAAQAVLREKCQKYRENIDILTVFRENLKDTLSSMESYELVLNELIDKSDIFSSIQDCTERCDALMLAQVEIARLEEEKMLELDVMRNRMLELTKSAALKVLGLKNELTALERLYNEAFNACCKWEKICNNSQIVINLNNLNKERGLDSIHQLYSLLCRRRRIVGNFQRDNMKNVLDVIRSEVFFLREILQECQDQTTVIMP